MLSFLHTVRNNGYKKTVKSGENVKSQNIELGKQDNRKSVSWADIVRGKTDTSMNNRMSNDNNAHSI